MYPLWVFYCHLVTRKMQSPLMNFAFGFLDYLVLPGLCITANSSALPHWDTARVNARGLGKGREVLHKWVLQRFPIPAQVHMRVGFGGCCCCGEGRLVSLVIWGLFSYCLLDRSFSRWKEPQPWSKSLIFVSQLVLLILKEGLCEEIVEIDAVCVSSQF